jgi:hypothetical protein
MPLIFAKGLSEAVHCTLIQVGYDKSIPAHDP